MTTRTLLVLTATVLALAGCGSEDEVDTPTASETVEIVATDFAFEPSSIELDAGGGVTLRLVNDGQAPHALALEGAEIESDEVAASESTELQAELEPGNYTLYCPVGNHREQGMEGTLVVGGGAAGAGTTGESGSESDDPYGYG